MGGAGISGAPERMRGGRPHASRAQSRHTGMRGSCGRPAISPLFPRVLCTTQTPTPTLAGHVEAALLCLKSLAHQYTVH